MKKSILQFSVIAAIAASMTLTTSCSSDESVAEAYVPEPVQFGIDLGDMTVARANTRSQSAGTATKWTTSIDGMLKKDDIVYIWTTDADDNIYRKAYYVKEVSDAATTSAGKNTLTPKESGATGNFYWKSQSDLKKYEIFSFGKSVVDSTNTSTKRVPAKLEQHYLFQVPQDQTLENEAKEFLYGYGQLSYSSSVRDLKVAHQLARIDINVVTAKNDVEVSKKIDETPISPSKSALSTKSLTLQIGWDDMYLKGYFISPAFTTNVTGSSTVIKGDKDDNTSFGTWDFNTLNTGGDVKGKITPRVLVEQRYDSENNNFVTEYSAVVMPQTVNKGTDWFTIDYDGATYKYKIPNGDGDSNFVIEPGKKYVYKVEFADAGIKVSVAIQEWNEAAGYTQTTPKDATAELQ